MTPLPHPHALIADKIPAWMLSANPQTHQQMRAASGAPAPWFANAVQMQPAVTHALAEDYAAYREAEQALAAVFEPLPALETFATELLASAIKARFELDLDVTRTYLFNAAKAEAYKAGIGADPIAGAQQAFKLATQPLLHCALQNFEAAEAQAGGLDGQNLQSVVLDSNEFYALTPTGTPLQLDPVAFAALVRELDIGGQYQARLAALSNPASEARAEQFAFRLELHRAYLGGTINLPLYEALLNLVRNGEAEYLESPLRCGFLDLFGAPLTGALIIGVVPSPELLLSYDVRYLPYKNVLVSYLPGAPVPLKMHTSVGEVQAYLREQLQGMDVRDLQKAVPARNSAAFFEKLLDCLKPIAWSTLKPAPGHQGGQAERVLDPEAWVPVKLQPFNRPLLEAMVEQKRQRRMDDTAFHAVSTAQEEHKSAEKRKAYFEQLAFDALSLGAFVVPGLGQLMLGLSVIQLSYEVFEGIERWADGDREQALGYLMDIIENVALTAALGATGASQGTPAGERIPVETPSFIETLEPVLMPDGTRRLWRPDLQPFAHDIVLPAGLQADEFGLYQHDGKTWLALDGNHYAVKQAATGDQYALLHPSKALSYEPPVRHNGAGAWLLKTERPQEWTGMRLFRRLGHLQAQFDEQTAMQILRVTDTDERVLRRVLSDNQRLPALLEDSMQRFRLDRQVRQALPEASVEVHNAEFQKRYRSLPASTSANAALIARVYPDLPPSITDELLRNASPAEQRLLNAGKVPNRMAGEIRIYQQQIRLAHAYDGLYLASSRNWDSDCLMLHTLALPGWPDDLRIELHQRQFSPAQTTSIGPEQASRQLSLSSARAGYLETPADDAPDDSLNVHDTLIDAVFEALSPDQRAALGSDGVTSATALRDLVRTAPLLPRTQLRQVLNMQRPGIRSPMRLADGRLGYPLSGAGALARSIRENLLRLINQSGLPERLTLSAELILSRLQAGGLRPGQIEARLVQVSDERQALRASLDQWREGQGVIAALGAREASRHEIERAIWRHWAFGALEHVSEVQNPLHLQQVFIAEFPPQLPDFITARTTHLRLDDIHLDYAADGTLGQDEFETQLTNLFQRFPNLQRLEISRPYIANAPASDLRTSLPTIIRSFPMIAELSFTNQNLRLFPTDLERLASRSLTRLDLSGNVLDQHSRFSFPDLQLDFLGLDRMTLAQWPVWLDSAALERIGELSLRHNEMTVVPAFLLRNELDDVHHTVVSLDGNALLPTQLQNLYLAQDDQLRRFSVNLDLPVALQERLSTLTEQRQQLRDAVFQWANASSSTTALSPETVAARTRAGSMIMDYWEGHIRGATLTPLHLENLRLDDFPARLPDFFYRNVEHIRLRNVDTSSEQLDTFLRRFHALGSLTLEGHVQPLQGLPAALHDTTRLYELNLREQGLEVNEQVLNGLASMRGLTVLDLSGNRVSPTLQGAFELSRPLHRLYLRNMGLEHWPAWLDDLMPLYVLDLDNNLLRELPEHILSNPENADGFTSLALSGNPLSDDTMRRAHLSQGRHRSFTFDMDLPLEILNLHPLEYASASDSPGNSPGSSNQSSGGSASSQASYHRHSPVPWRPGDVPDVQTWLQGADEMQSAQRALWQRLEQTQQAADLLALVGRLSQSAPYRTALSRSEFIERVWRVLGMADSNPESRQLFNGMAQDGASSKTCHDGALLVFKQIEEQLLIQQMGVAQPGVNHDQYMIRMTRRLFRQQTLDRLAREQAGERDEAELRLAYHRRLATPLDLPTPADYMLYEGAARLNRGEVEAVERKVREAEAGEAFVQFAVTFAPWVEHLRTTYAERFERIDNEYLEGEERVDEQVRNDPNLSRDLLIQALLENRENQQRQLLHELTNRASQQMT